MMLRITRMADTAPITAPMIESYGVAIVLKIGPEIYPRAAATIMKRALKIIVPKIIYLLI
jgi:hypothetical protein